MLTSHRGTRSTGALLLALWSAACAPAVQSPPSHQVHLLEGSTMGTSYTVRLVTDGRAEGRLTSLQAAVQGVLDGIDRQMSTYRADSELSRFNALRTTEAFPVSPETLEVFRHALEISRLTEGAFDVTVGPLVDAWGFGPTGAPTMFPSNDDVARLLDHVGYEHLEIDITASTLRKTDPLIQADLSALAKGFAVDRVVELLVAEGLESLLVEVGGEIRTRGQSERGDAWRVGIERPSAGPPAVLRLVPLRGLSLATSGDYRNYYDVEGRRLSHTIDPRTGQPVGHALTSVSVIDPLCVRADALATALEVLGPERGYALAVDQGWAALLVARREDGRLDERETPAFTRLTAES